MKCPSCHTENAAEAKFCGNCGHSLTEEVVASSGKKKSRNKHVRHKQRKLY